MKWFKILIPIFLLPLLVACSHAVNGQPSLATAGAQKAPPPAEEYRIQAGDQLDIKFFYNKELNEQVTVRPDGRISLQLVRSIMAAGLTPEQLMDQLAKVYSSTLKDPEVAVIVRSFSSQRVYVDGEVAKPGLIPLAGPTTVLQAISQAGGSLYTGNVTDVMLIRRGPEGQPLTRMVNMEKVRDGSDLAQDIYLKPFDIVYIPKTAIANVNLWIEQYMNRMVPRIGFLYSLPVGGGATVGVDTSTTIVTPVK